MLIRRPVARALAPLLIVASVACAREQEELDPAVDAPQTVSVTPTPLAPAPTPSVTPAIILTPGPGVMLWRWTNVLIAIPEDDAVYALAESTPSGGHGIRVVRDRRVAGELSHALIDAETGAIILSEILDEDRAIMEAILATIKVSPLDPATAPWPYDGLSPSADQRDFAAGFSFLSPAPETGWHPYSGIGDPCCEFIGMTNGRSTVVVSLHPRTGELVVDFPWISEEDRPAIERWLESVQVCGTEAGC